MRIAVIGSWRASDQRDWSLRDHAGFKAAAGLLGRRLIELGHSLIVGSDRPDTADYCAAVGAVEVAPQTATRRIHILAPRKKGVDAQPFADLRAKHPRLFNPRPIPAESWAPAKVFQVREADAAVILGGAQGSQQAGLTAAVSRTRLVCIGSFGGAAQSLNDLFMQSRESWDGNLPDVDTLGVLQNPWNDTLLEEVLPALRALRKPRLLIVHGRAVDRDELKQYLRDTLGLPEPIVLADLKTPSNLIPEKFNQLASDVDAAIALCTPDDVGGLAAEGTQEFRARQNVWLEIGWFWGRLGLRRVLILTRGAVEVPSDLGGVESYAYDTRPSERATEIEAFLASVGDGK